MSNRFTARFFFLLGVLDIYNLAKNDEGLYFCTANNITSYAYLKVLRKLSILRNIHKYA